MASDTGEALLHVHSNDSWSNFSTCGRCCVRAAGWPWFGTGSRTKPVMTDRISVLVQRWRNPLILLVVVLRQYNSAEAHRVLQDRRASVRCDAPSYTLVVADRDARSSTLHLPCASPSKTRKPLGTRSRSASSLPTTSASRLRSRYAALPIMFCAVDEVLGR